MGTAWSVSPQPSLLCARAVLQKLTASEGTEGPDMGLKKRVWSVPHTQCLSVERKQWGRSFPGAGGAWGRQ